MSGPQAQRWFLLLLTAVDNDVLLQTNPDFTIHFLNPSTFLEVIWLTQCCMTVKPCNRLAVRGHRFEDIKFIQVFLFISMHISLVFVFPGTAETYIK